MREYNIVPLMLRENFQNPFYITLLNFIFQIMNALNEGRIEFKKPSVVNLQHES